MRDGQLTGVPARRARWPLSERSDALELLDRGLVTGEELETNLADLARLNRLPGGTAASVAAVRRLARTGHAISVLDVGTGGGELPLAFAREGWRVVAVDSDPAVLDVARRRTAGEPAIEVVAGDGRSLPLDDGVVDVAHASLLVHHLDPPAAVALLRELRRVSRLGVVVNDLRRGIVPLLATAVSLTVLGRCRTTRHDGLLSVRRAYRLAELDTLLADAGLRTVHRSPAWLPRVVTVAVGADR